MIFPPIPIANYAQLLVVQAATKDVRPYVPVGFQSGGETWFDGSGSFVCNDAGAWSQVWNRHLQNEQIGNVGIGNLNSAPAVDFNHNVVLALFSGPMRGVVGYRVVGGLLIGKKATLRLTPVLSQGRSSAVALPRPWAFIVLPRTIATVSVQMPRGDGWGTIATVRPSL